jgi:hypothetical protein
VAFRAGAGGDTGTFFDRQFKQYMMTDYQALVYHDDLSEYSEPFWFRDFMSAAKSCGLEYLGEADFFEMQQHLYPEPVVQFLRNLPPGEAEQYLDFLKCRQLRQTLLCREGTGRTEPRAETVRRFFVASPAQPDENGKFHGSRGASLQTPDPAIRAVFMRLGSLWPQAVHFRDLPQLPELDEVLLEAYWSGMVRFYLDPPRFTLEPGERPIASPLARLKAMEDSIVSTLLHSVTELEDADRELIVRMDGTRRREEFPAEALKRLARMGLMLA